MPPEGRPWVLGSCSACSSRPTAGPAAEAVRRLLWIERVTTRECLPPQIRRRIVVFNRRTAITPLEFIVQQVGGRCLALGPAARVQALRRTANAHLRPHVGGAFVGQRV